MAIQKSERGSPITSANFDAPYESVITRFGTKGLNLVDVVDRVDPEEATRMLNITHHADGGMTARLGQTVSQASVGTTLHTIRRLTSPQSGTFKFVKGADSNLYVDNTLVDSGYSGRPLVMVPYRPPLSGQSWMFIAEKNRMRKVRDDGLDLEIGLHPPVAAVTTALAAEKKTSIANFLNDGTQAASWSGNVGYSFGDETHAPAPVGTSTVITVGANPTDGSDGVGFQTNASGFPVGGYYSFWGTAVTRDLSKVGGATAADEDYIHLWINFSHPDKIQEFRIYFVCSASFSTAIVPGISGASGANGDSYVKAFTAADLAPFLQGTFTQTDAAERARLRSLRDEDLRSRGIDPTKRTQTGGIMSQAAQKAAELYDAQRTITVTITAAAADQDYELGVVGMPLRRGDFQRIGTAPNRDWSTITGIICYVKVAEGGSNCVTRLHNLYMTGGSGPDSGAAEDSPYDYRYTHYDTRTGAESNPSPIQADTAFLDALRRGITATPAAYGDAAIRQRFYRRGGTLVTDWFNVGQNTGDGAAFTDTIDDTDAGAANALETDNDQPVSTVDFNGTTVLNQPLPALWGPIDDLLMGCGDPYRPGHVYFCKPGKPDSWPADNATEVCAPSETLQNGGMYGAQAFVFSNERMYHLYPNLNGDSINVTAVPTQCRRGMVNRWGMVPGPGGIYFVARDGIYRTAGGPEEWISRKIDPLFRGETVNTIAPIDFSVFPEQIRLEIHENELWFKFKDNTACNRIFIYNILLNFWKHYEFGQEPACMYSDEGPTSRMLFGGQTSGVMYEHSGTSDAGVAITCQFRTGSYSSERPREEKRLGDQYLDLNNRNVSVSLQNFLNQETVGSSVNSVTGGGSRQRAVFDTFGTTPQRVNSLSSEITWASAATPPIVYALGTTFILEPDVTVNRVTQWEDMGPDAKYLMGVTFDCDTGGQNRTIIVEYDNNGTTQTAATLTVNCNGRHKRKFSWNGVQADKVRIRPNDDCLAWQLFRCDWLTYAEPPNIPGWDTFFENKWDQYYTGVDLFCDTFGLTKTVEVYVDEVLVKTENVNTNGRLVRHITLPWGRGHVFRLRATDGNPGMLYDVRWQLDPEPSEQTNWNQNFTVEGIESDKYLKAVVFQCDTFGQNKNITVECDGIVVEAFTINTNGRKVVQKSFPQHLGRVFRVYPTDDFPGRLYSLWWVFDQEPLALDRWETQEVTQSINGWQFPVYAHVTVKSTQDVTMQVLAYNQTGVSTSRIYTIPATAGLKQKRFVPFQAVKGVLFKYILTSPDPFWLYKEETVIYIREWGTDEMRIEKPFGNDDLDVTRAMTKASEAAQRPGGGGGTV